MLSHALRVKNRNGRASEKADRTSTSTTSTSNSNNQFENTNFETLRMVNGVCPNFIQFRDSAHAYCLSQLGPVANIISTNERYLPSPVIDPDQVLNDSNDPHRTKRLMHEQRVKNRENEIHQLESISEPKLFGLLWGNCSEESKDRIMRCQVVADADDDASEPADVTYINDWTDVYAKSDSTRLWDRILNTHVGSDSGILVLNAAEAKSKYEKNRQGKSQTLVAYKTQFKFNLDTCDAYAVTGHLVMESEAEQAVRFINGLDNLRYAHFRANLVNNANNGSAAYPDTWQKAFDLASKFKVVSNAGHVVEASAFHVSTTSKSPTKSHSRQDPSSQKHASKKKSSDSHKGSKNQPRNCDSNPSSTQCNKDCPICQAKAPTHWQRDCPVVQKAKEIHFQEQSEPKVEAPSRKGRVNIAFSRDVLSDEGAVLHSHQIGDPLSISPQHSAIYMNVSFISSAHPNISKFHVLHDNQANVSIFCNRELLSNIRPAEIPCHVGGINADGTPLIANFIGDFNEFRGVYYHPDASANILSFSETAEFCVNHYLPDRQSFTCTPPSGTTYEFQLIDGLYAFEVSSKQAFPSVAQNIQAYIYIYIYFFIYIFF